MNVVQLLVMRVMLFLVVTILICMTFFMKGFVNSAAVM